MLLKSLRDTLSKLDRIDGLIYLFAKALRRLSGGRARVVRYHFFAQPVPREPKTHARPSLKSTVRQISADDPVIAAFPRSAAVIARRFQSGATCFVAEHDGRFTGYLWLAKGAFEEDEVRCRYEFVPSQICAWDFDVFVEPEYRIGRTFARLWDAANAYLSQEGVLWSFSRITPLNLSSIAAHQRLGLEKLCSATFICFGSTQVSFVPKTHKIPVLRHPTIALTAPNTDLRHQGQASSKKNVE